MWRTQCCKSRRERDVCNAPHCEDAANRYDFTQNSTTMSKHFKIITKEVGRERPIETEYIGDVDRAYLIKFFALREPDVEWFRIEEIQKD